jgi:hypothetical protein
MGSTHGTSGAASARDSLPRPGEQPGRIARAAGRVTRKGARRFSPTPARAADRRARCGTACVGPVRADTVRRVGRRGVDAIEARCAAASSGQWKSFFERRDHRAATTSSESAIVMPSLRCTCLRPLLTDRRQPPLPAPVRRIPARVDAVDRRHPRGRCGGSVGDSRSLPVAGRADAHDGTGALRRSAIRVGAGRTARTGSRSAARPPG